MSYSARVSGGNKLLSGLPAEDADVLAAIGRTEHFAAGRLLSSREVWFPHVGLIALVVTDSTGRAVQAGLVGSDGCVGLNAALDLPGPTPDAIVQIEGVMSVVPANALRGAWTGRPSLRLSLSRWLVGMSAQSLQTIACNRLHGLSARTCRWLLTMQEQSGRDDLPVTQEALAQLLGSGRPRINQLLSSLEAEGLLLRRRGRIHLLDFVGLAARACDCYRETSHRRSSCAPAGVNDATVPAVTDL